MSSPENSCVSTIRVGTSGFSFDDWRGSFYPAGLPRGKLFDYYATQFDTVEINSTYYAIPRPSVFEQLAIKSPAEFQFTVKAHASATHQRDQLKEQTPRFLEAVRPLIERRLLRGIVLQFPWAFQASTPNRNHLQRCRTAFGDLPLFVEFRHASWNRPELFDWLKRQQLQFVTVDEPQLPHMMPPVEQITGEAGYIRLHGRNAQAWYSGDGQERYNYKYSEAELVEWQQKIERMSSKGSQLFVLFNNCRDGHAAFNARRMMQLLGIRTRTGGGSEQLF